MGGLRVPARRIASRHESRQARLALLVSVLASATLCALLLFGTSLRGPGASLALAAPRVTAPPTGTSTATIPTTATTPASSATTLKLISPASAHGPVGAKLTFFGERWSGTQVTLTAATTSCSSPTGSLGQATIPASGSFTTTIVWPATLAASGTAYLLCATDDSGSSAIAAQIYRVRSASPPALALSLSQAAVGQEVHLEGSNFVGASRVTLIVQTANGQHPLATLVPDPKDGSFVQNYIPVRSDMGTVTLTASSAPDGSAPPALQAAASLTIGPPLAPTATVYATAVPTSDPAIVFATPSEGGLDSLGLGVLLAVGSLLLLLAVGVAAWLILLPGKPRYAPPRPEVTSRQTARAPVAAGSRRGLFNYGMRADDPPDPPDRSGPAPDWRARPMSSAVRSFADDYDHHYDDDHHDHNSYAGDQGFGNGYADDGRWMGLAAEDDQPTVPGNSNYFGLPLLHEPNPAATQPRVPHRSHARE